MPWGLVRQGVRRLFLGEDGGVRKPLQNLAICLVLLAAMAPAWRRAWALARPRTEPATAFAPLSHMLMSGFFLVQGFFIEMPR